MVATICILFAIQWISCILAGVNIVLKRQKNSARSPDFTIIRPFFGLDYAAHNNIYSVNKIKYQGKVKYLYCVETDKDPAIDIIKECVSANNSYNTKILVGVADYKNPKLANIAKATLQLDTEFTAVVDSNVNVDSTYLTNAVGVYDSRKNTGLLSAPPLAVGAKNFWARMEASTLNTHQLRWQYVADLFGFGFAQGKNLIFKTELLSLIGGIKNLDKYAEDAAFTKEVRKLQQQVVLMTPTKMNLGFRTFREFWKRQVRWARLRRKTFPLEFLPEIFSNSFLLIILLLMSHMAFVPLLSLIFIYYLPETILAILLDVSITPFYFVECFIRDILAIVIWFFAWGNTIEWRGRIQSIKD